MKVSNGMVRVPALTAVEWREGLEVEGGELVEFKGMVYMNEQRTGLNSRNPAVEGGGYTRALEGRRLIAALIRYNEGDK